MRHCKRSQISEEIYFFISGREGVLCRIYLTWSGFEPGPGSLIIYCDRLRVFRVLDPYVTLCVRTQVRTVLYVVQLFRPRTPSPIS